MKLKRGEKKKKEGKKAAMCHWALLTRLIMWQSKDKLVFSVKTREIRLHFFSFFLKMVDPSNISGILLHLTHLII